MGNTLNLLTCCNMNSSVINKEDVMKVTGYIINCLVLVAAFFVSGYMRESTAAAKENAKAMHENTRAIIQLKGAIDLQQATFDLEVKRLDSNIKGLTDNLETISGRIYLLESRR